MMIMLISLGFADNSVDNQGERSYKKLCVECHEGPYKGAAMHTIDEWSSIAEKSNVPFIELHKGVPDALKKLEYSLNEKRSMHLVRFFIDNAKDSGTVPGSGSEG